MRTFLITCLLFLVCPLTVSAEAVIDHPQAFALGLDANTFLQDRYKLTQYPKMSACHTQGIEIVDNDLFVSCCLYGEKATRDTIAKSYLLKADLREIEAGKPHIDWQIAMMAGSSDNQTAEVFGHPSGLVYDEKAKGLWVANAVYKAKSKASLALYDPENFFVTLQPKTAPITINDHIGTIALLPDGRIMGMNWDSILLYFIEPKSVKSPITPKAGKPNQLMVAYQDCDQWTGQSFICGGVTGTNKDLDNGKTEKIRLGRVDILTLDKKERFQAKPVYMRKGEGGKTVDLGVRKYITQNDQPNQRLTPDNNYGGFQTDRPLTNEGMAVSPDGKYLYFLPTDLPGAMLVRYEIMRTTK